MRFVKERAPQCRVVAAERSESNRKFLDGDIANDFPGVLITDDLDSLDPDSVFDLVVAFGVFEHVKNGSRFLELVRNRLRDEDSRLVLSMPNKRNPLVYFYGIDEFWKFLYMKQHYITYTEKSLQMLAERAGCAIERFIYQQVWGLDNHLSWLKMKRPMDFGKYTDLLSEETLSSYNNDLVKRKMTDLLIVVMKKIRS